MHVRGEADWISIWYSWHAPGLASEHAIKMRSIGFTTALVILGCRQRFIHPALFHCQVFIQAVMSPVPNSESSLEDTWHVFHPVSQWNVQ